VISDEWKQYIVLSIGQRKERKRKDEIQDGRFTPP